MKKKRKPTRSGAKPAAEEDALDELEALAAIYGPAFKVAADGASFSLLVRALESDAVALDDSTSAPAVLLVRRARAWRLRSSVAGCALRRARRGSALTQRLLRSCRARRCRRRA